MQAYKFETTVKENGIILDIALERQPFVEQATQLFKAAQQADVVLFVTATTITDLYYITRKAQGRAAALNFINPESFLQSL
jgi:hypothetical protein